MYRALVLALFFALCFPAVSAGGGLSLPLLRGALSSMQARPLSSTSTLTATVNATFTSEAEVKARVLRAASLLGMHGAVRTVVTPVLHAARVSENGMSVRVQSVRLGFTDGPSGRTTLIVSSRQATAASEEDIAQSVAKLAPLGLQYRLALTEVAEIPGQITNTMMRRYARQISRRAGARLVGSLHGAQRFTETMDATDLEPSVRVAGRPMNLQVAFSYDRRTGWTRVLLGTPVIAIPY